MDENNYYNVSIRKSDGIVKKLHIINIIFLLIGIIEIIGMVYLSTVLSENLSVLMILTGLMLIGSTYIAYMMLSGFITLLDQTTMQNKLLLQIEENQKKQINTLSLNSTSTGNDLANFDESKPQNKINFPISKKETNITMNNGNVEYYQLMNSIEEWILEKITLKGKVIQIIDDNTLKVGISSNGESSYVLIIIGSLSDIRIGRWIKAKGEIVGSRKITDIKGSTLEMPLIEATEGIVEIDY